jgi:hypothetical protein
MMRSRAVVLTGMTGALRPVVTFLPQACRHGLGEHNVGPEQR